jgi:hypothetical protein
MPTVTHVLWPKMGLDYGKMFKITSMSELHSYWDEGRAVRLRDGMNNYLNSAEFARQTGVNSLCQHHLSHPDAAYLDIACTGESMKDSPRSVVEVTVDAFNGILFGMVDVLVKFGAIYVNEQGGYFTLSDGMEEKSSQTVASWVIPGADIRVKHWPRGTHWYAYVGSVSVTRDGKNSWDTKDEAYENARLWAKEHRVKLE